MRRAILLGAAFAVLTAAVQAGWLHPVDRYAIHHLQPFASDTFEKNVAPPEPVSALAPIVSGDRIAIASGFAIVLAPADTAAALILVAGVGLVLRRRGRPRAAVAWMAAILAGLVIEVAGKGLVDQLGFGTSVTVLGVTIDGSYPSGHTIRSVIMAAMVASVWPRARYAVIAWAVVVTVLLEIGGLHVPTDIAGGFLVGGALACAALAYGGDSIRAVGPVLPIQSGSHAPAQAPRPADVQAPPGAADGGGRRPGADRGAEQPEAG
jgi:membrane-associated phospholipid phosphatase